MILVTGSEALRDWGIDVKRDRLDIDLIVERASEDEVAIFDYYGTISEGDKIQKVDRDTEGYTFVHPVGDGVILDIEHGDTKAGDELVNILRNSTTLVKKYQSTKFGQWWSVHPSVVLALKLSHKYKKDSPHFLKTMRDIQRLKALGYKVPKCLSEWLKKRKKLTYVYKHPKLKDNDKSGFFTGDGVNYVYDHDSIHEAVKHLDKPAYRFFQPDGEEVHVDKSAFFNLPEPVRLLAVLEEAYVLSLERAIIPFDLFKDPVACKRAFGTALIKVCSSITSGWFRKYSYDNFDIVCRLYNIEYVSRFKELADSGRVVPYTKPSY